MSVETLSAVQSPTATSVPSNVDLVEFYYDKGWTDGLPVVPPTADKIDAVVAALGGSESGGIRQEQDRVAHGAELHALVARRQKARAPEAIVQRLPAGAPAR